MQLKRTLGGPGDGHNIICVQSPCAPLPLPLSHLSVTHPFLPLFLAVATNEISGAITLPPGLLCSPSVNHCLSFEHTPAVKGHCLLSLPPSLLSCSLSLKAILSYSIKSPLHVTLPYINVSLTVVTCKQAPHTFFSNVLHQIRTTQNESHKIGKLNAVLT